MIHLAQMVVLIGDDKQLGPVVHSQEAREKGLGMSLFERIHLLYKGEPFITLLNEQYRMNEKLYEFPNRYFYENKMISKRKILPDENVMSNLPFPNKDFPSIFIHVSGGEKIENKSFYNIKEIDSIFKYVSKLNKNNVDLKKYQDLKIDSVDGFQGMELPYIILSTVRSNLQGNLGFLSVENRLNVSLTRAKKGLILVGDAICLAKRPGIFRELIEFYCSNGLILNNPFIIPEIKKKKKKKKKAKKVEEDENEEEEDEYQKEEEDLKKKGNKKWRIKNLHKKKKIAEQKFKEKEEEKEIKVEEEKVEEDKKGKKGKKNKAKKNDNENEVKDKKNSKNKGKGKKK